MRTPVPRQTPFRYPGANAAFKRSASLGEGSAAREEAIEEALTGWGEALDACMRAPLAATATANRLAETLRCNRAAALLKIDRFADARRECELALGVNPDCVKALYRGAEVRGYGSCGSVPRRWRAWPKALRDFSLP